MNKLLLGIAASAIATVGLVGPSSAITCSGTCSGPTPNTFTNPPPGGLFATYGDSAVPAGAVLDQFEFQLVPPPSAFDDVTNAILLPVGGVITGLMLSIWDCTDSSCGTATKIASSTTTVNTPFGEAIAVSADDLTPGYYYIQVSGTGPNTARSYGGSMEITSAPIPGALALFSGGLALLGFTGFRKGRKRARTQGSLATAS